jgi:uncharacterized protein YxeA
MEQKTAHSHHDPIIEPKKKTNKGLTVTLALVIILAIAAIGGTWYYMNNKAKNDKKAQDAQIQQLQKQVDELKTQANSQSAQQTDANLTSYEVSGTPLSVKYPKGWYTLGCPRNAGDIVTTDLMASAKAYLAVCNSDKIGQISIITSTKSQNIQAPTGWTESNVVVNGINMKKYVAPANQPYAQGSSLVFVKQVQYQFSKGSYYYSLDYTQTNEMPDVYSDFEKIVNSVAIK